MKPAIHMFVSRNRKGLIQVLCGLNRSFDLPLRITLVPNRVTCKRCMKELDGMVDAIWENRHSK